jgi:NADH-quinone oxidoreductase subunit J
MEVIIYYTLFAITVGFAVGVLLNKNTVKSAMCLIGVMASIAVNFLLMQQELIAFIQIIVYTGAIMVLFLFVIMLLNLREQESTPWYLRSTRFWGGVFSLAFFFVLAYGMQIFSLTTTSPKMLATQQELAKAETPEIIVISTMMITKYIVPFLLTSVLLLVAVIGAIVMARRIDEDGNEITIEEELG